MSVLFYLIKETMPQNNPGSLDEYSYGVVLAYILKLNGFAPGADSLKADSSAMRHIRIGVSQRADTAKPTSR